MKVTQETVDTLDLLTREGKTNQVRAIFKLIILKKIPRSFCEPLANIARRNNLMLITLKVLNPIIRNTKVLDKPVTDNELLTYASGLSFLGFGEEARKVILQVKNKKLPERNLQLAFVYFNLWNYRGAIPILKRYIKSQPPGTYYHIVGLVNLTAAYLTTPHFEKTNELIQTLLEHTNTPQYKLLRANTHELFSQVYFRAGEYQKAIEQAQLALATFPDKESLYFFFAQKWEALSKLLLDPNSAASIKQVQAIKERAKILHHWETLRDCDLYLAYTLKNPELLNKLIWGTPLPFFRKKIEQLWQRKIKKESVFVLRDSSITDLKENSKIKIDLTINSEFLNELQQNIHSYHFLIFLFTDFYRRKTFGEIFSHLYPGQFFDPATSAKRVLNHFFILKKILQQYKIPIKLEHKGFEFIWELDAKAELILPNQLPTSSLQFFYNKLRHFFKGRTFQSKDISQRLSFSKRKTQYLLKEAVQAKLISVINQGPITRYKL